MAKEDFVTVEGLNIDFTVPGGTLHAVRDVSFGIAPGDTLCIVGESGSGKSMTALGLMGLLPSNAQRSARQLRVGCECLLNQRLESPAANDLDTLTRLVQFVSDNRRLVAVDSGLQKIPPFGGLADDRITGGLA
jgi:ABC-type glutathione transport system ATPase component